MKVDLHVATEGSEDETLQRELEKIGLCPDELLDRHVTFADNVALSACPLIGIHMTKKYDHLSPERALSAGKCDMLAVQTYLEESGQVGYAHMEITLPGYDVTLKSNRGIMIQTPWPVRPFKPRFRDENKKWDIHIAVPTSKLTPELAQVFYDSGMYFIELMKIRDGVQQRFRIFTIQSVSNSSEGKQLFQSLKKWFEDINAPHIEMKFEVYADMFRVGAPAIVPPTIDKIAYATAATMAHPSAAMAVR